jgi:hypothetical protein
VATDIHLDHEAENLKHLVIVMKKL